MVLPVQGEEAAALDNLQVLLPQVIQEMADLARLSLLILFKIKNVYLDKDIKQNGAFC
jgi:hypothetical protein